MEPDGAAAELLGRLVSEGAFPGAVLWATTPGRRVAAFAGRLSSVPGAAPVEVGTRYDLASVTKPYVATATILLAHRGVLSLDDAVGRHLPELAPDKAGITIRQLLAHTGGLAPGAALQPRPTEPDGMRRRILDLPLVGRPRGQVVYSSAGYVLLGWLLERVAGRRLDALLRDLILDPLGCRETGFRPAPAEREAIAATERLSSGEVVQGRVHDETAGILGGVAGHAGLFGPAMDVAGFGAALLSGESLGAGAWRPPLFENQTGGLQPARSAAFVIDDPVFSRFSAPVFSHTGFTGTSLCLVPDRGLVVVLLTNRINPSRDNSRIALARTRVHELVASLL